jgi:hypothetical protein
MAPREMRRAVRTAGLPIDLVQFVRAKIALLPHLRR